MRPPSGRPVEFLESSLDLYFLSKEPVYGTKDAPQAFQSSLHRSLPPVTKRMDTPEGHERSLFRCSTL